MTRDDTTKIHFATYQLFQMTSDPNQAKPLEAKLESPVISLDLERWSMELEDFVRDISGELSDIVSGVGGAMMSESVAGEPTIVQDETVKSEITDQPIPESGNAEQMVAEPRVSENIDPAPVIAGPAIDVVPTPPRPTTPQSRPVPVEDPETSGPSRLQKLMDRLEAVQASDPDRKDPK